MTETEATVRLIDNAVHALRAELDMDVAFIAELVDEQLVFRYVDTETMGDRVQPGSSIALANSYVAAMIHGSAPGVIPDTQAPTLAGHLPVEPKIGVRSVIAAPIRTPDGAAIGAIACASRDRCPGLSESDLKLMRVMGSFASEHIPLDGRLPAAAGELSQRIKSVLFGDGLSLHYQPIVQVADGHIVGYEALSRFAPTPIQPPDRWFADAAACSMGVALEKKAIRLALDALDVVPEDCYVTVNASAATLQDRSVISLLAQYPLDRVVVELTEHETVTHYQTLADDLECLRRAGLRLAVDDAGAGYASLQHILNLDPDVIKLDMSLVQQIHRDPSRWAMTRALQRFAADTETTLLAEGVESPKEWRAIHGIGVEQAQGYLFARPMPLADAIRLSHGHA